VLQVVYVRLQIGVAKYDAIYGTFAAVPIFLLWLYFSWLVILYGAELTYADANHTDLQYGGLTFSPSAAYREQLALGAMTIAGRAFAKEEPPPTCEEIAHQLIAPVRVMREVMADLVGARLLTEVHSDEPRFQPAAPLEQITLVRILRATDEKGDESPQTMNALKRLGVAEVLSARAQAEEKAGSTSLREIVKAAEGRKETTQGRV
jgi:membrane protein